jgi:hypothetical protein
MSKLDMLLEAERRGILPADKVEMLAEARRRGLVPGGEADNTSSGPEHYLRLANAYIPGSARLRAAVGAAGDYFTGGDDQRSFGERYDDRLKREWARDDEAQRDASLSGIAARTAGLGVSTLGTGGLAMLRSALPATATVPQLAMEGARIGAGIGAPTGLLNSRSGTPMGQAGDVVEGALGGAALGAALPIGGAAWRFATRPLRPSDASRAAAAAVRDDFNAAGVPVLGPALSDSPTIAATGRGLTCSVLGSPIRGQAQASIDAAEQRARDIIAPGGGPASQGQFGADTQAFLRQQLRGYSRPASELDDMTRAELEAVRGIANHNSRETYPTQFGARYRLAEMEDVPGFGAAANVRANFVEPTPALGRGATATYELLNDLGREARAAGRLKGWRDGNLDDSRFWVMARGQLGDDVANQLHSEYMRGVLSQANLRIPGLRDQRTFVRRALEDAQHGPPQPGAAQRAAALQRLHGAMSDDLQRFLNSAGGSNASLNYLVTDAAYQRFAQDIREPLRRVFNADVTPDQAFRRLLAATQRDTADTRLLQSYYRVLTDKGGALPATRALLAPALENGLPGFLGFMRNLSPDARAIMFRNQSTARLGDELDRLVRVATRLEPYQRALAGGGQLGIDFSRPSNLALGAGLLWHIPATIAAAGGVHALARVMARPAFVRWLADLPGRAAWGVRNPAFSAHMARLNVLASDDAAVGEAIMKAVGDVVGAAHAGPGGPVVSGNQPLQGEGSGSEWTDNNARIQQARPEGERVSPWMPAVPGTRDENSFKPWLQWWPGYPHPTMEGRDPAFRQRTRF